MLLKFLDGMRPRRLGAQRELTLSLRVIATSSKEPLELVKSGRFHENLYRRLAVFRVNVPSLVERRDEISTLGQSFIEHFSGCMQKEVHGLSAEAKARLLGYAFPGNVRELRTIMERAVVTAKGALLSAADLELDEREGAPTPAPGRFFQLDTAADGVPPPLEAVEQAYVRRVLEHTRGRRMAAAQLLGISYPTFLKRLRELDIDKPESGVHPAALTRRAR
jgi:DNA-binding NtrC family response regulator